MKRFLFVCACVLGFAGAAQAQTSSYSVGIFQGTITDANAGAAISIVTYPAATVICGLVKQTAINGVVNPTTALLDDPADASKDCRIPVASQMQALTAGNGYRLAIKANSSAASSVYSVLSNTFNRVTTTGLPPAVPTTPRAK